MATPVSTGTRSLPQSQSQGAQLAGHDTVHDIVHDSTNDLLRELIEQMKMSDAKVSAFIDSQQRTNKELSDKLNHLNRLTDSVAQNSQRIAKLEQDSAELTCVIHDLKSAQFFHESHNGNELMVSGLPSALPISPSQLAGNVLTALGVPDLACHVLGPRVVKRSRSESSASSTSSGSVIVTLASNAVRDAVIIKKRARGILRASEVCGGNSDRIIHVNEFLTKSAYDMLQRAKSIAKEKSYKYVWIRNGRICVRHANGEPVIYVDSDTDLAKIV
ncbi:uncharacterized protein LOC143905905 [Temnothorax americanus]|uniref:uncharacterized protein LOC143905905 n=1 Tax=Temnothorax americanus TaxID=1964332 RepID=UPI004068E56D